MKYIFLFVNPTSGGNRASIFTQLDIKEIIFHKPELCHIYIYDILDGNVGEKPGFLNLSAIIRKIREKNGTKETKETKETNTEYKFKSTRKSFPAKPICSHVEKGVKSLIKNYETKDEVRFDLKEIESHSNSETFTDSLKHKKEFCYEEETIPDYQEKTSSQDITNVNSKNCEEKENIKMKTIKTVGINDHNSEVEREHAKKKKTDMKKDGQKDFHTFVLVAGGDGTINWVLKESERYKINNDDFVIGVIPFGTGNDFARAFGWKRIEVAYNHVHLIQFLKTIVEQTLKAKIEKHDYWNITVTVKDKGYFNKINSKTKKKETLKEDDKEIKVLDLYMSNYFSIGIDSRIGRGFERHRKKNASCNKLVYALEGFKKITFKKNIPLNLIIDKMVKGKEFDDVVFTTNSSISSSHNYPLLKNAMSLICINIPSYSSGNDIWNYTHKIGLKLPININEEDKLNYELLKNAQQEMGDGMLEFVIYQSSIDLGLEFTLKGRAYRIHQGVGPWKIYFKEQQYNVYFQVDGEFYLMSLPDYISIEHYKKVNVLKNIL